MVHCRVAKTRQRIRKNQSGEGGKHHSESSDLLYLPRSSGGQGLKSMESEYKITKIEVATRL